MYCGLGYFRGGFIFALFAQKVKARNEEFSENLSAQLGSIPKRVELQAVINTRSVNFNSGISTSMG